MENWATSHKVDGVVQEGAFGLANAEENPYNSQYNANDILDLLERELLRPDNAEDPSVARQKCPSIEGSLVANSQIKRAAETVGKKQRKCPYKGVKQRRGKWVAEVRHPIKGKNVWIGSYDSPLEAARAYDAEARRVRGKKARLNFPDEAPPKKTCKSEKTRKCTQFPERSTLPGHSAGSGDAQGQNSNVEAIVSLLNETPQIFKSDSPLQSRYAESPMPRDMHISSVETPPVISQDQVQGINPENFLSEFVSKFRSVENHTESWNSNSDYNYNYFDGWCSPQGVDDANTPKTSSALSPAVAADWANINGIYEGINTTIMGNVAEQARMGNVAGQTIMDIPEAILQNASPLIERTVMQPQTSQMTLKSNSIKEPGMDSCLTSFQFPESTGHPDTSGTYVPLPEQWDFDDDMSKYGF